MNKTTYTNSRRYVYSLKLEDPIDLLHDAYLKWYDKTGNDLFDEPQYRVFAIIKYTFKAQLKQGDWSIGGKDSYNGKKMKKFVTPRHTSKRQYSNFNDGSSYGSVQDDSTTNNLADKYDHTTPLDILIEKETRERYLNLANSDKSLKILELKAMGLRNNEIAEKWNVSKGLVAYYLKNIDQKAILN